jgi:MFS transporter, FHS family, L-fucose permease
MEPKSRLVEDGEEARPVDDTTTSDMAVGTVERPTADEQTVGKLPLVYPDMRIPFALLILCFIAWGTAQDLTAPMVAAFKGIFTMSTLQASLVQFAYFGAYFALALPAAFINQRYGYKVGVLTGLGLAAIGGAMFYPASLALTYGFFLAALFVLAAGLSILETSANPFAIAMGPEENSTKRLNLAQAFNPLGTNMGVLLATVLIYPYLNPATAEQRAGMPPEWLREIQTTELHAVMGPYIGLAVALALIWVAIWVKKTPKSHETTTSEARDPELTFGRTARRLFRNPSYTFGVVAQFFNVAAQVCVWTYIIIYVDEIVPGGDKILGAYFLQASLIVFFIARFVMVWLMNFFRATLLLSVLGFAAVALCLYAAFVPGTSGAYALVAVSFCLSLMFPTIYGVSLRGLGPDTKFGAAFLVMAIVGGAIMPAVMGAVTDAANAAVAFVVPAACFAVVACYGLYDLTRKRSGAEEETEIVMSGH